jgi:hypothetical protein
MNLNVLGNPSTPATCLDLKELSDNLTSTSKHTDVTRFQFRSNIQKHKDVCENKYTNFTIIVSKL